MWSFKKEEEKRVEHTHAWNQWSDKGELKLMKAFPWGADLVNPGLASKPGVDVKFIFFGYVQYRTCKICGLTRQQVVGTSKMEDE